ncbi:YdcF family protein [Solihabitans fulvus]|uniref:YdcF family protein n=1 Tax=Solihabitans fulvus TaxID=1892852 RepID=UPI001CB76815|nr:YdcF family protein [Solihabitans fulvus]
MSPHSGVRRLVLRVVLGACLIGGLVVGGTAFRVWQVARVDDRSPADIAVVLGAAQYNGRPSPVLQARLEHAKSLFDEGVVRYLLTTGGRQPGDKYTEGQAGQMWLAAHGVPEDRIVVVGEGRDTLGSMQAVATVAKERGLSTAMIVSDPWHSLRARTMAQDAGLRAWTSPTHSGPIVQTRDTQSRYILRETGALLYYRLFHAPADDFGTEVG